MDPLLADIPLGKEGRQIETLTQVSNSKLNAFSQDGSLWILQVWLILHPTHHHSHPAAHQMV